MTNEELIQEIQCPGCMSGPDPKNCEKFKLKQHGQDCGFHCKGHKAGTRAFPGSMFFLGLVPGFNKDINNPIIRLHKRNGFKMKWDALNIPVWFKIQNGFMYVKTFLPRVNCIMIDVIEQGTEADIQFNTVSCDKLSLPDMKNYKSIDISKVEMD